MTSMKGRVEGEGAGALWYLSGFVCLMLILMYGLLVIFLFQCICKDV